MRGRNCPKGRTSLLTAGVFVSLHDAKVEVRLRELHRWLTLEGSSGALMGLALFLPYGFVFTVLRWGAIFFSPFLLWRLLQFKRYGWIAGFVIFVGLPFSVAFLSEAEGAAGFLVSVLPLVSFYAYTWMLRYAVEGWLEDITGARLAQGSSP